MVYHNIKHLLKLPVAQNVLYSGKKNKKKNIFINLNVHAHYFPYFIFRLILASSNLSLNIFE